MKRLVGLMVLAASLALVPLGQALAERTLRITTQLPPNHELSQNIAYFKELVEKESNGALKIEIYELGAALQG